MTQIITSLSRELSLEAWQVSHTLALFEEGATIPFIARYRKERTGGLDEVNLLEIKKLNDRLIALDQRRDAIRSALEERGLLTPELDASLTSAGSMSDLEDVYLPYKPKRKTKGVLAIEKGLEPLARMIMSEHITDPMKTAHGFISRERGVVSVDDALQGARDIMAEWVNERMPVRHRLRRLFHFEARLVSSVKKGKEQEGEKYKSYFAWEEPASKAPSHRILAVLRGEKEGYLQVKILPEKEKAVEIILKYLIKGSGEAARQKEMAVRDAVTRLLFPSLENEFRSHLKQKADEAAVKVFSENLRQLLLAPPMGQKKVMAIDPGFRTGCKVVCLDEQGNLRNNDTIYPHPPVNEKGAAIKKLKSLVNAYQIEAIAVGNGTAGRETEDLLMRIKFDRNLILAMVNESGASVYSASNIARQEFPQYDVTVRGAVSIGRRLIDPLAELVKIDPRAIGVGQYQHDVDQKMLQESLQTTVESCVNSVGVDLNTASRELLSYVSGIGRRLAEEIVSYRATKGNFTSREELLRVKGMGERTFQLCAGFLRIKESENPLDASAVHPESYPIVESMAAKLGVEIHELIGNKALIEKINLNAYVSSETGLPTLKDIIAELEKPGRDPRRTFRPFTFNKDIRKIEDVKPGMILPAIVTNLTAFGAFVDLGIHESGLIHKSRIAEEYVADPKDYLHLNQQLQVKVIEVDVQRKRIALSLIGV
jgi:protein Tex